MVKYLLFFFAALAVAAPDNAIRITPAATQTSRPFTRFRVFAEGEICNYPAPYVDGGLPAIWQADIHSRWPASSRCGSGSVKGAWISWYANTTATVQQVVDFRDTADRCSSGNDAACNATSLNQAAMVNFNSGAWGAAMTAAAYPQGITTARNISAKTMLNAGFWSYRLRGPVVTQVVVEDRATTLTYDFGWIQRRMAIQNQYVSFRIQANDTSTPVMTAAHWTGITRPFNVVMESEVASVCFVAADRIYFGTTNGSDATCATTAGRGVSGTTAALHTGQPIFLQEATYLTAPTTYFATTLTVNNNSMFAGGQLPKVIQLGTEKINICYLSGLTIGAGTGAGGCTPSTAGRGYWGTGSSLYTLTTNTPFYDWQNATDVWVDAPAAGQKSLHPVFVLGFYPTFNAVSVEYHMVNAWASKIQDQEYRVDYYIGEPAVTYVDSKSHVRHVPNTMWKYPDGPTVGTYDAANRPYLGERTIWTGQSGRVPKAVTEDYNRDYIRYTKMLPNDFTISLSQTGLNNVLTTNVSHSQGTTPAWDNGTKSAIETATTLQTSPGYSGPVFRALASPGIRQDIGINPTWSLTGLYAMGSGLTGASRWYEWTIGTGATAGYVPYIFWEDNTSTSMKYCAGGQSIAQPSAYSCTGANLAVNAFGNPVSIDARPTAGASNSDDPNYCIGVCTTNYWEMNDINGHMPELLFIQWLLTGDWYFETVGIARAAWVLYSANTYPGFNPNDKIYWTNKQFRKGSWGWLGPIGAGGGPRNIAWGLRNLANGAFIAKDGTADKEYLTKKLNTNLAIMEGKWNVTTGNYYEPCPINVTCAPDYSYWLFGRQRQGYDLTSMGTFSFIDAVGGAQSNDQPALIDSAITRSMSSNWGEGYFMWVMGDIVSKGFTQASPAHAKQATTQINFVKDPANPQPLNVAAYRSPVNPCSPLGCNSYPQDIGQEFLFSNMASWFNGWTTAGKANYGTVYVDSPNDPQGRPWVFYSGFAGAYDVASGSYTGKQAFDFWRGAVPYQNTAPDNPSWFSAPNIWYQIKNLRVANITATTATAYFTRPEKENSCGYLVGTTFPNTIAANTGTITNTAGGYQVTQALTGLTTATSYWVRITCGPARGYVRFTTE